MVVPVRTRALTRSRRVALLRKDRQGVASTIGTIMALLVIGSFGLLFWAGWIVGPLLAMVSAVIPGRWIGIQALDDL